MVAADKAVRGMSMATAGLQGLGLLRAFLNAWNDHDIEAIMALVSDDCVYESSVGPDPWGRRYEGKDQVRQAFASVWASVPDASWSDAHHWISANRAVSEWLFTGTRNDGTRIEVRGCDLYILRDGKIALKSTFLKSRVPPAAPR